MQKVKVAKFSKVKNNVCIFFDFYSSSLKQITEITLEYFWVLTGFVLLYILVTICHVN